MHYGAMLVGQFIKAAEFGTGTTPAQPTWTIKNVALEKLESVAVGDNEGSGKLKTKGIVYFAEVDRGWVINRTNAECLAGMFGVETNDWIDKRVTLYAASVRVGSKTDIGIRIKGSPDLEQEVTVEVKLPRRKAQPYKLIPTGTPRVDTTTLTVQGRTAALLGETPDERSAALAAWWKALPAPAKAAMKQVLDETLKPLAQTGAADPHF